MCSINEEVKGEKQLQFTFVWSAVMCASCNLLKNQGVVICQYLFYVIIKPHGDMKEIVNVVA